jgi:hypothetical protein
LTIEEIVNRDAEKKALKRQAKLQQRQDVAPEQGLVASEISAIPLAVDESASGEDEELFS